MDFVSYHCPRINVITNFNFVNMRETKPTTHKLCINKPLDFGYRRKSTLTKEKKNIQVNRNCISALGSTSSGVPQGSVLGPFLFLLYIDDTSCDLTNNVRLFADDTSLYIVVDQDIVGADKSLTIDLGKLDRWSIQWLVDFNPKKTINLNFTGKNINHPIIKFGGNGPEVNITNCHVHLGLNFQSDFICKAHTRSKCTAYA